MADKEELVQISVRVPPALLDLANGMKSKHTPRSAVLRVALELGMAALKATPSLLEEADPVRRGPKPKA